MEIKIKHGYEKPVGDDLNVFQLGWAIDDGILYIKDDDGEIKPVIAKSFIEDTIRSYVNSDEFKNKINTIINGDKE